MANDRQNEEVVYIPINENQEPRGNFIKLTVWVPEDRSAAADHTGKMKLVINCDRPGFTV